MKIALCVKQVPDTTDIRWTKNNTIQREGVESVINPYDVYAAELALKIKSKIPLFKNIFIPNIIPSRHGNIVKTKSNDSPAPSTKTSYILVFFIKP